MANIERANFDFAVMKVAYPGLSKPVVQHHAEALYDAMSKLEMLTPLRVAASLAQFAHETGGFRWLRELGSSSYFRKYEGRKELGNIHPGDGARFRGRGYIQITGRYNYEFMEKRTGLPLLENPQLAEQPVSAAIISCCWWVDHGLNELADVKKFRTITRLINGGYNGHEERKKQYDRLISFWSTS